MSWTLLLSSSCLLSLLVSTSLSMLWVSIFCSRISFLTFCLVLTYVIFFSSFFLVERIPESFDSVQKYLESFVFPLLEEIQAELCSAVEAASSSPFAEVLSEKQQHKMPYYSMMSRLVRGETDRVTQARSHTVCRS